MRLNHTPEGAAPYVLVVNSGPEIADAHSLQAFFAPRGGPHSVEIDDQAEMCGSFPAQRVRPRRVVAGQPLHRGERRPYAGPGAAFVIFTRRSTAA